MTAILLLSCADQKGLVASIANFISDNGGNIVNMDEHVDSYAKMFFIRVEWEIGGILFGKDELHSRFKPLAEKFDAKWKIEFAEKKPKLAIFVSKYDHALQEILWRYKLDEFDVEILSIISNHTDLATLADNYNIPFYHFQISKENKIEQEGKEIELLKKLDVDLIVLARYMQILSENFVSKFPNKIINIHHSFLPAFIGGNPYKQAYERGVKMIGATSHFVTNDLDEGPIIAQDIVRISHKDSVKDLVRKGRDLERLVLAKALHSFLDHRVLVHKGKTIVFE
ncbi:MAG: formyltetrahydrofolate deformylase [Melioribacteraceae bacterium]|nr:formyltetrahydrofolate deformylase [Melioribacteraceae bacterium]